MDSGRDLEFYMRVMGGQPYLADIFEVPVVIDRRDDVERLVFRRRGNRSEP